MDLEHDTLVWFSKSFGLFYLIALAIIVLVYAYLAVEQEAVRSRREVDPAQ